jgi:signal transduction histidine kinase
VKILKNLTLAKKLTFYTLALSITGTIFTIGLVYKSIVEINQKMLSREIEANKAIITRAYVEPLWSFDSKQIEEVSNSFLEDNGYVTTFALKVVDANGVILFSKNNFNEKKEDLKFYSKLPFTKSTELEIKNNDEIIGKVYITFSTNEIMRMHQKILSEILLISCFIWIAISFGINHIFNKMLTIPFNNLLSNVGQIKNQNYNKKEISTSSREMQELAGALDYAAYIIKKRNDELKSHSENLELLVDERTRELEAQIINNVNSSRLVAVGEMASGIAHEINNPLTVINGQVAMLKRQIKNLEQEDKLENHLEKISLMSSRIVKIVNGLKLISRDGSADLMVDFSIHNMLEEIKLLTEMKIKAMNIKFTIEIELEIQMAHGREVQISQVLVNLVNNSIDAIHNQNEKWIKISVESYVDLIRFTITDSGDGIPKELQEKIMQPFFTTKGVGKGTGLGLSISRGIIQEHGGEFKYNDKCINTQFIFTIHKANKITIAA